jgi:hypothetical protein
MKKFRAKIEIIGINPFVFIPNDILENIFRKSGMNKGPIPIKGEVNKIPYKQTLVKYSGAWRLYINMKMLKNSPQRIGEEILLSIDFDPDDRSIGPHELLVLAFIENTEAKMVFNNLSKAKQQEINRYIFRLKTEESVHRNIQRAINFLNGKERFLGRDKP